jgi:hypothetical protein
MAIRVRKFEIGKDRALDDVNRFLSNAGLRSADIIDTNLASQIDKTTLTIIYEDSSAPRVLQTIPSQGDPTVAPGTSVVVIFSEPIQNVTTADISIRNLTDAVDVSDTSYTIDNSEASANQGVIRILDTPGFLVDQKAFRITLLTSIQDLAGNNMEEPYDLVFGASVGAGALTFDGGQESSFSNPSLNRWETSVTPTTVTFSAATLLQLTMQGPDGMDADGFNIHYEPLVSPTGTFRIVVEHGNHLSVPEPTAVLPTGFEVDWLAVNGLL